MPKSKGKTGEKNRGPLHEVLENLVRPFMDEVAVDAQEDFEPVSIHEKEEGHPVLEAMIGQGFLLRVEPYAIDGERTMLRVFYLAGHFLGKAALHAAVLGHLIENRAFQIRYSDGLFETGQLSIGFDLVARADDEALVWMRLAELARLAMNLEWYYPMWMPVRLSWPSLLGNEVDWDDLPKGGELETFLETAMGAPPIERTPRVLLRVAQGLGEWKTVLRLFREHPEELALEEFGPLKMLAHKECGQWLKAIRTAEECGIEEGAFPESPWMSPSYLHALVAVGEEIEALRLLGPSCDEEPPFYDWLRGFALHRAGDENGAMEAFARYFQYWPNDMVALAATREMAGDEG
jgi:tetratricopeptide (TPR) repeat protein